jgi:hypothetical protein
MLSPVLAVLLLRLPSLRKSDAQTKISVARRVRVRHVEGPRFPSELHSDWLAGWLAGRHRSDLHAFFFAIPGLFVFCWLLIAILQF